MSKTTPQALSVPANPLSYLLFVVVLVVPLPVNLIVDPTFGGLIFGGILVLVICDDVIMAKQI